MKGVLLLLSGNVIGSATMAFYCLRAGLFGRQELGLTLQESKTTMYKTILHRGFFKDHITILRTNRVDECMYNFDTSGNWPFNKALQELRFSSLKPIEFEIVKFDRETELNAKLKEAVTRVSAEKPFDSDFQSRKIKTQIALLEVIKDF